MIINKIGEYNIYFGTVHFLFPLFFFYYIYDQLLVNNDNVCYRIPNLPYQQEEKKNRLKRDKYS